ncbi:MAG: RtcB family protein [Candidatus Freyarchaeota archaeon]|nr:RtcB family protein [Candidatus Jordarchaeia archaeon]
MRVPARIFANEELLDGMKKDQTLVQAMNVACLPGIQKVSVALPDAHQGYGFPIGGVAAVDFEEDGVVSPGGVGYDINCGVRLLRTNLLKDDVTPKLKELLSILFREIPSGVGSEGKIRMSSSELDDVLESGVNWAIEKGLGWEEDRLYCEEEGCLKNADASRVSSKARGRGSPQLGTLGSGNHFLEVQYVEQVYDEEAAKQMKLFEGQITVLIHTGSRGLGHQICSDYLKIMEHAMGKYGISLPDRELAAVPGKSKEGEDYLAAMASAANFAWANRQCITHWVRESFEKVFSSSSEDLGIQVVYDVAHNIAKFERHRVDGEEKVLCVHRKGATRAFPPSHPDIPQKYKGIGQPVLIPGTMGTASYVLRGRAESMELSFGSTAHGAGRRLSRAVAKKRFWGEKVKNELQRSGILVEAASIVVMSEEAPEAYKDVDIVVDVSHKVGIASLVAKLRPIGVVKG